MVQMLTELTSLLRRLKDDAKCLVVLLTSAGSSFCSGIDYPALFSDDPDVRLASAQRVASLIRYPVNLQETGFGVGQF